MLYNRGDFVMVIQALTEEYNAADDSGPCVGVCGSGLWSRERFSFKEGLDC